LNQLIEQHLETLLTFPALPEQQLHEAAHYALFAGGKRLRPLLTLATVQALKGDVNAALTPACALEMVHTYSLIHDDLPCMDDDDFRRGKPTVHKKFDEATALLAGDFLLTYAFQVLAEATSLSHEQRILLIQVLATHAGGNGMIGGQMLDLQATNRTISFEQLTLMHQKKTGQLMTAALKFGGIVAHASSAVMNELVQFGEHIGLAFQIMDDVIDVEASEQKHGKATSSDQTLNKTTYVSQLGVNGAKKAADAHLSHALHTIGHFPHPLPLTLMAQALVNRRY
jgi:geranylgeranyl diphosphate synthase type II